MKIKGLKFLGLCFFLLSPILVGAQLNSDNFNLKVFGFEEGLSHRNVFKINQDSAGFLWIGTINGLNKYDGKKFTKYSSEEILNDALISDILPDKSREIWTAYPGGVCRFIEGTQDDQKYIPDSSSILFNKSWRPKNLFKTSKKGVACLGQDNNSGTLVLMRSGEEGKLEDMLSFPNKSNFTPTVFWEKQVVIEAFPGVLWFIKGISIKKLVLPEQNAFVTDFFIGKKKNLFILLSDGTVFKVPKGTTQLQTLETGEKDGGIQCFYREENGSFWFGGYGVLQYYDAQTQTTINLHPTLRQIVQNTCQVRQIFKDKLGVTWVATDFGLVRITRPNDLFTSILSGGNEYCNNGYCSMRGIAEDRDGRLYFSYYNNIHFFEPETRKLRPLFPNREFSFSPYDLKWFENELYTGNGLKVNLNSKVVDTLLFPLRGGEGVLAIDTKNQLWLGLEDSLYQLKNGAWKFWLDLSKNEVGNITYLLPTKNGESLLVGTSAKGIFKINIQSDEIIHLSQKLEPELRILCLSLDHLNQIWAGTSRGVMCFDSTGSNSVTFNKSSGLENDFINGLILEGDSAIWVSTDNGLSRLVKNFENINEDQPVLKSVKNYQQEDGLSANEFNRISFLKSASGTYYFGGLNGITSFKPGPRFWKEKTVREAALMLTGFSKFDGKKDSLINLSTLQISKQGIRLGPRDKFFQFDFSLLDFENPETNQYQYYLEGYEKDWSASAENGSVRYDNLPAGSYVFHVKASKDGFHWNSQELRIPVFIEKPFYKTTWFLVACSLFLLASIWTFIRWRVYNLKKRKEQLELEVKNRTTELEEEKLKSEKLLLNILPEETAEELKQYGKAKAKRYEVATVLFTDFRNFSKVAEHMEPEELVSQIDYCFRSFDTIIEKYHLEKIKTIGDAYMCAGGLSENVNPKEVALNVVKAAMEIRDFMDDDIKKRKEKGEPILEIRIGIHSGPVVAGVVGHKKFAYDIWGDTVNIASRMETYGLPGRVNISQQTWLLIYDYLNAEPHEIFITKNEVPIQMYFL
ncbi:MAG: adenylate/guanylate cyclase domain-containing protein [Saprospiraceae bacterium]